MDQVITGEKPLRVERIGGITLWFLLLFYGGVAVGCFCVLGWYVLYAPASTVNLVLELVFLALTAAGVAVIWFTLKYKATFWRDRIESTNGFATRILMRSGVSGYRRNPRTQSIVLLPTDPLGKPISISEQALHDPATSEWFRDLPDISAQERRDAEKTLLENPRLGATPQERQKRYRQMSRAAEVLDAAGFGLAAWLYFWPRPYEVAVLSGIGAVLLALALKLYFGPLVSLDDDKNNAPRLALTINTFFVLPAIAVALRALLDINLLDWQPELVWSGGLCLVLCAMVVPRSGPLKVNAAVAFVFLPILFFAFSYGALAELNEIFDVSRPQVFRTTVRDKHAETGRHRSYKLVLSAWGDQISGDEALVTPSYYKSVQVGQPICVYLFSGALGFRHFNVGRCAS